jgi:hypothetical protein
MMPRDIPQVLIDKSKDSVNSGDQYSVNGEKGKLFLGGECDDVIREIIKEAGWTDEISKILPEAIKSKLN